MSYRLLLAFNLTRKGYCLLYQQVKLESKYLQMLKVYGFCVLLKIKLLIPPEWILQLLQRYYFLLTFIGTSNVYMLLNYIAHFSGIGNLLLWCFLFNCWNKHLILGKVHRNTEVSYFPKNFLIKILRKNISGAKIFIDVYAYVQLTCLNLEEKMPSVEDLAA